MNTNELIAALSNDSIRPPAPGRALALALIPGVAIAICLFLATLGLRPQFLSLLGEPRFLFKLLLLDLLAALSGYLVLRLFRPGPPPRAAVLALAIPPASARRGDLRRTRCRSGGAVGRPHDGPKFDGVHAQHPVSGPGAADCDFARAALWRAGASGARRRRGGAVRRSHRRRRSTPCTAPMIRRFSSRSGIRSQLPS